MCVGLANEKLCVGSFWTERKETVSRKRVLQASDFQSLEKKKKKKKEPKMERWFGKRTCGRLVPGTNTAPAASHSYRESGSVK